MTTANIDPSLSPLYLTARAFAMAVVISGLLFGLATAASDLLSDADYRWLGQNLNVGSDSLVLQGLTTAQKIRVHALIGATGLNADQKLRAVADYLSRVNGDDFEEMLKRSEQ